MIQDYKPNFTFNKERVGKKESTKSHNERILKKLVDKSNRSEIIVNKIDLKIGEAIGRRILNLISGSVIFIIRGVQKIDNPHIKERIEHDKA